LDSEEVEIKRFSNVSKLPWPISFPVAEICWAIQLCIGIGNDSRREISGMAQK